MMLKILLLLFSCINIFPILLGIAAQSSNKTKDVEKFNKYANKFNTENYFKIMKFSIHLSKAIGPWTLSVSAIIAEALEFGFYQLNPDEKAIFDKLYNSMNKRFREQSNKTAHLKNTFPRMFHLQSYDTTVSKPLTHLANRYFEIRSHQNTTTARHPFVKQCRRYGGTNLILDDVEWHTITQCLFPTNQNFQTFVAAQKVIHFYEEKFNFTFENDETLMKDKIGFLSTALSSDSKEDINWYLNPRQIVSKEILLEKLKSFGENEERCWLKEIFVSTNFKRTGLEAGTTIILLDLAKIREMTVYCANISKLDVKWEIENAHNKSEKISKYLQKYAEHLMVNSWPATIQQRIKNFLKTNSELSNNTANLIKAEIDSMTSAETKFHVILTNVVDDDPILIKTSCFTEIDCLNFVEGKVRVVVYPFKANDAKKKYKKAEKYWKEFGGSIKDALDELAGNSVSTIFQIIDQKFPELKNIFQSILMLSNYGASDGLIVGSSLGELNEIQLYQVIFKSYGHDVTAQDYGLYFLL